MLQSWSNTIIFLKQVGCRGQYSLPAELKYFSKVLDYLSSCPRDTIPIIFAGKLEGSRFNTPEDIENMTKCFDKTTKLRFRNPGEPSYIKFGGVRDKDPVIGIRSGQLKLAG